MIDLDWRVHETDGVALVAAVVQNAAPTQRRIVVDPRIDGAVLPPRRRGLPERGWSDEGFAGVVPAEGRIALGFASRGELEDPPVAVLDEGRAPQEGTTASRADGTTPTDVLRNFGSPVPPRDAVPNGSLESGSSRDRRSGGYHVRGAVNEPPETTRSDGLGAREIPAPVIDWLDDVASRVDRAERLAKDRDLEGAATAVESVGGIAAVEQLVEALGADEAVLRAVADRATELADASEIREDVPVDAYRQLA